MKTRECRSAAGLWSPTPQLRGDSNKMFTVYVLKSKKDGKFYIGSTGNFSLRLKQHDDGLVKSTRNRRPLDLVYKEEFDTKKEALAREKYFKGGGRARKLLKELIEGSVVQRQDSGLQNQ